MDDTVLMPEAAPRRSLRVLLIALVVVGILTISAACWHSIEEIHYLKSFYPRQFSVEEAFYASAVELVKAALIGIPSILVVCVCLYALRNLAGKP